MMKVTTAALALVILISCGESVPFTKKVHYIFLFDKIDDHIVKEFEHFFNASHSGNKKITQYQPKGYSQINMSVYCTAAYEGDNQVEVNFTNHIRKKSREKLAIDFLRALRKLADSTKEHSDLNVFRSLQHIFSTINDTAVQYEVFLSSSLVENAGGATPPPDPENGEGEKKSFRFVTQQGEFMPQELDSARHQLDSGRGWIGRNFTKKYNREYFRQYHVSMHVCHKLPDLSCSASGRYPVEIDEFWESFWEMTGIHYSKCGGNFNMNEQAFFVQ